MLSQNGYLVLETNRTTGSLPRLRKWIIPGTGRHLFLRDGSAGFLLAHVALWFHENIDPLSGGVWDEWGWAVRPVRGQTSGYSNHASGTAEDLDATRHPRGVKGTFTAAEKAKVHEQLKVYGGAIRWGEDYSGTVDGMHFEINQALDRAEAKARELWDSPYGKRVLDANPGAAAVIWDGKIPGRRIEAPPRGVDYSYEHPPAEAIARGGYQLAMRYVSSKATKNLTEAERRELHAAGVAVGLVFEEHANRAGEGRAAGAVDASDAERYADLLGYPMDCPIFYAVDYDATPAAVEPYFDGIKANARRPVGVYGSARIVEAGLARWRWQTAAWSNGVISPSAHLFQRVGHLGSIPGYSGAWDENDILADFPTWGPTDPKELDMTPDELRKIVREEVERVAGDVVPVPKAMKGKVWAEGNDTVTLKHAVSYLLDQSYADGGDVEPPKA